MIFRQLITSLILCFIIGINIQFTTASSLFKDEFVLSHLEYQTAANYTHLKWLPQPQSTIKIHLLPIQNHSGIPIQKRDEKADYYYHGKIPQDTQLLFSDLINTSRYFQSALLSTAPDYQFQLTIKQYRLPFDYAPDDIWWKELNADVDRWFVSPKNANVKLSLKIFSGGRHISTWRRSIETTLSVCDLNQKIQPLTSKQNANKVINEYVKTTLGQAFIASSNYLILQAIHHISQQPQIAKVISNEHNEIFIISNESSFMLGEKLALYYHPNDHIQSALPAGEIEIIKTYKNQAVAYPIDLRVDQIKPGDWVEMGRAYPYQPPKFNFVGKNNCAPVKIVQNDRIN